MELGGGQKQENRTREPDGAKEFTRIWKFALNSSIQAIGAKHGIIDQIVN